MAAPGVCAIKPEFVKQAVLDKPEEVDVQEQPSTSTSEPNIKRKLSPADSSDQGKSKRLRGQNKSRPKTFVHDKTKVPCSTIVDVKVSEVLPVCQKKNCTLIHDPIEYLKNKPKDISQECYMYNESGYCRRGLTCRFAGRHIEADGRNIVNEEKQSEWTNRVYNDETRNLQFALERRKYNLQKAEMIKEQIDQMLNDRKQDSAVGSSQPDNDSSGVHSESVENLEDKQHVSSTTDEEIIVATKREKINIDWKNKLYLSPLTTVGNLPFRRICKEYGADITCSEMVLCESLLKGNKQEWALLKRHSCEDVFGVQICGPNSSVIGKVAQVIEENIKVDFVDLNLGCPIDLVYKKGGGCSMMQRARALESSIRCATAILSVPFTVKMRTGVYQDKKIAHTLLPNMAEYGVSMVTLHGRSRESRYSRLADWEYINKCASLAGPLPLYGNGDILTFEDYVAKRETAPSVQGVMIGRGALIKPWLFTEIKEQRTWDISSMERFDIIKRYTNYGLEHWGSDTIGVENTRRFLLEWCSFLHRYVPVGLLERPPQKINQRPPAFFGRNDLETLMASGNCSDWIKISEMLLGPVPEGFKFLPKHKANSY